MKPFLSVLNILVLLVGIVIIVLVSVNTIYPEVNIPLQWTLNIMAIACVITFMDFWIRFYYSNTKMKYFFSNLIFLVSAIPFLNISHYMHVELSNFENLLVHFVPFIRGGQSLIIVIRWSPLRKVQTLFFSYLIVILAFTYFCSLLFYQLEKGLNPMVEDFWSAFTWACMNLTTVGSNIYGKTRIGQSLSFILAALGMLLFPIFTAYITAVFQDKLLKQTKKIEQEEEQVNRNIIDKGIG
ncbi:MAG: ion channel [Rikenellaceae bacterium]